MNRYPAEIPVHIPEGRRCRHAWQRKAIVGPFMEMISIFLNFRSKNPLYTGHERIPAA